MKRLFPSLLVLFSITTALAQPVADGNFLQDGVLTNGSPTLTSAQGKFVSSNVGKSIQCGPSNYSGIIVDTTIKTFNSATSVDLAINAPSSASSLLCQWGTDNTTAMGVLAQSGQPIKLPVGCILSRSINATHTTALMFEGSGNPVNDFGRICQVGTWLVPMNETYPLLDLTGAVNPTVRHLQIGTTLSPISGNIGVWYSHSSTVTATEGRMDDVFITGAWQVAHYNYGVAEFFVRNSDIWTYKPQWIAVMYSADNPYGFGSQYATVATGNNYGITGSFDNTEFHAFIAGGGSTAGHALRLRGVHLFACRYCGIDSSSYNGTIMIEAAAGGRINDRHYFEMTTIYNEQSPLAVHCVNNASGTYTSVIMMNVTCQSSGTAMIDPNGKALGGVQGFNHP